MSLIEAAGPAVEFGRSALDPAVELNALMQQHHESGPDVRAGIAGIANEHIGSAASRDVQEALSVAAGILEWKMFGRPGDPLPVGLLKVCDRDMSGVTVEEDPRYLRHEYFGILHLWREAGMDNLWGTRAAGRAENQDSLYPLVVKLFAQTPIGKRLCALTDRPLCDTEDKPLPLYMIAAREKKVRDRLKAEFGIRDPQTIEGNSAARIALRSEMYRISNETLPQTKRQQSDDAFAAARSFINSMVKRGMELEKPGTIVVGEPYAKDHGLYVQTDKGEEKYVFVDTALKAATKEAIGPLDYRIEGLEKVSYHIARQILDGETDLPYDQFLDQALRRVFLSKQSHEFGINGSEPWFGIAAFAALKQATGEVIPYDTYIDMVRKYGGYERRSVPTDMDISLHDRDTIDKLKHTFIGSVHVDDEYRGTQKRIYTLVPRDKSIPDYAPNASGVLFMTLDEALNDPNDPRIPGMQLVARRPYGPNSHAMKYTFAPSPEGDPYAPCLVEIPSDKQQALADTYRDIGMIDLADKVASAATLTVEQLKNYAREEGEYLYPNYSWGMNGGGVNLYTFRSFVENGKLACQCTGYAHFMQASIDLAFGPGRAMVIGGTSIPMHDGKLDIAGHAQVSANLNGQLYILDSTPGWTKPPKTTPPPQTGRSITEHQPVVVGRYAKADMITEQAYRSLENGRDVLESQLMRAFGAKNQDQLYLALARLSEEDPIRRSVALILEASKGSPLDIQEAGKVLDILKVLINKERPEVARQLGWSRYGQALLTLVSGELQRIGKAEVDKRAAKAAGLPVY